MWHALCECGNQTIVNITQVRNGHTMSCGCLQKEGIIRRSTVHGLSRTKEYRSWAMMLQRCSNPNNKKYHRYGGRGISVHNSWYNFRNFYKDMGKCPVGCTLDRIDNDGNYEPMNCQWADSKTQAYNTSQVILVGISGIKYSCSAAAIKLGVQSSSIRERVRNGQSHQEAVDHFLLKNNLRVIGNSRKMINSLLEAA